MKKSCWNILGIKETNDISAIKTAYRNLIKEYHPDKCQAPEKIRKNTIKCVEIIQAYKTAIELAKTIQTEPLFNHECSPSTRKQPEKASIWARLSGTAIGLFILSTMLFLFLDMAGISGIFSKGMRFIFEGYASMPLDNPFKIIISLPLALLFGAVCNGLLSIFTSAPVLYLWGVFANTSYEKYMYKVGFIIVTVANICIVYFAIGLHWPFENIVTPYYIFLCELCRFLAWSYAPIYMLLDWLKDNFKYSRVKNSFNSNDLAIIID